MPVHDLLVWPLQGSRVLDQSFMDLLVVGEDYSVPVYLMETMLSSSQRPHSPVSAILSDWTHSGTSLRLRAHTIAHATPLTLNISTSMQAIPPLSHPAEFNAFDVPGFPRSLRY